MFLFWDTVIGTLGHEVAIAEGALTSLGPHKKSLSAILASRDGTGNRHDQNEIETLKMKNFKD